MNSPLSKTIDGRAIPANQAELLKQYREALKALKPKTLENILKLREQFKRRGMLI